MPGVSKERKKTGGSAIVAKNNAMFKRRKAGIKKKTEELSVLCGIKACAIIISPDGKIETWPESSGEVIDMIKRYRDCVGKKTGNEVASTSMAESEIEDLGLPCSFSTANNEFESNAHGFASTSKNHESDCDIEGWINWECSDPPLLDTEVLGLPTSSSARDEIEAVAKGLAAGVPNEEEIEAEIELFPRKLNAGAPCNEQSLDWDFECFDPAELGFDALGLPSISTASHQFEVDVGGLITDGSNDFQESSVTSNAQASHEQELPQEIRGWMDWECFDVSQLEFDEWMNVDWDCSALG